MLLWIPSKVWREPQERGVYPVEVSIHPTVLYKSCIIDYSLCESMYYLRIYILKYDFLMCTHTHTNQLSPTAIFNYNMPSLQSKKCNVTQPQQCGVRQVFPWIRISCLYVLCYAFQLPIVQAAFQAIFPIERWVYAFRWTPSLWWVSNKRFFSCPYIIYTACLRVFGTARGIRRRERRRERVGRGTSHPLRNRTDPSY